MAKKAIYCTKCDAEIDHEVTIDANGEIICRCDCGHFMKFPAPDDPADLQAWIAKHKEHNEPNVKKQKAHEAKLKKAQDALDALS